MSDKYQQYIIFRMDDGGGRPSRCHRKRINQKALIKMREHPFHSKVTSTWCQQSRQKNRGKVSSQHRSPDGICQPYLTVGQRQLTRMPPTPRIISRHSSAPHLGVEEEEKPNKAPQSETHSCNNSPTSSAEAGDPAIAPEMGVLHL